MGFKEDCLKVKEAANELSILSWNIRDAILERFAEQLINNSETIIKANEDDVHNAQQNGITESLTDRLRLDIKRVASMAQGVLDIVKLDDPIGNILEERTMPSGIYIVKKTVPIGVIGIIYEARPNVTADSMALCIKSGNACVLKGGKEAIHSNTAIVSLMKQTLKEFGFNENFVLLIEDTSRETTNQLMKLKGVIDVLIPRGGKHLINAVVENSTVPVIETGAGNCHIFIDETADAEMGVNILDNAKTSRPSVCNAVETLLVHERMANTFLPMAFERLSAKNVEFRGCETTIAILGNQIKPATEEDYETEFNDYILAVKVVSDIREAVKHIRKYYTQHSEAIITQNQENADYFTKSIDSAAVYVNASTRFTDGGEFGLGAEIGISTQKLHARGPMGLKELTSYKYIVKGNGEIR